MSRFASLACSCLFVFVASPAALTAQEAEYESPDAAKMIKMAMSAAPASIAGHATITDTDGNVLRDGTNGWTCVTTEDPMCLDEQFAGFIHAYMNKETPSVTETGFGYMLNCCTEGGSNVDPFAEAATDDNEWLEAGGPHLMVVVATADALAGLPTHPKEGGPWVMWRDTPYAHIMVPLGKHGPMHERMHEGMHEKDMGCQ